MRILAVLGIEVMACVTILTRITRRPPARGARLHTGREAPKSSKGEMRAEPLRSARSEDGPRAITGTDTAEIISGPAWAVRHQGENDR